jgi:hypothetical protein
MKKLSLLVSSIVMVTANFAQTNYVANTANSATPGTDNTLVGPNAGNGSMTGNLNTFLGDNAGRNNTTGVANTYGGASAAYSSTTGSFNTFYGEFAGYDNTTGNYNTLIGFTVARRNTTGRSNVAVGARANYSNQTGNNNVAIGDSAGFNNTVSGNLFAGSHAGFSNTTGIKNTCLGYYAGYKSNTGNGNVFIGYQAGYHENAANNRLYIGNDSNRTILYGNFNTGQVLLGKPDPMGYDFPGKRTLNVIGGILTDSIRVAPVNLWSDHVFEKDYQLPSLQELELFIRQNKHLPGIPTATQVAKDGINLAELNSRLLEKIEELTLYIIAQQKRIEKLETSMYSTIH